LTTAAAGTTAGGAALADDFPAGFSTGLAAGGAEGFSLGAAGFDAGFSTGATLGGGGTSGLPAGFSAGAVTLAGGAGSVALPAGALFDGAAAVGFSLALGFASALPEPAGCDPQPSAQTSQPASIRLNTLRCFRFFIYLFSLTITLSKNASPRE
jgi:hypothetical protein